MYSFLLHTWDFVTKNTMYLQALYQTMAMADD